VRTRADVEQVLVRGGRAEGVRLRGGEEIRARAVIGAAGVHNTLRLLPDEERGLPWVQSLESIAPSVSHVCLYLGFKGDVRAHGASETNQWLLTDHVTRPWNCERDDVSAYVSFPSLKDGEDHRAEGYHAAEVISVCDWSPFERFGAGPGRWRHRSDEYARFKDEVAEKLLRKFFQQYPGLRPLLAHQELSTPWSNVHFTRAVQGATYGLRVTPERFLNPHLKPRTPIRGLVMAGSDVAVVGIVGALVGGLAAAFALEPERAPAFLRNSIRGRGAARPLAMGD
jgi:all-trans-retinol 13,14-reductase